MNPNNAGHSNESHWRENHHAIVHIARIIKRLWNYLYPEKCSGTEQFSEKSNYDEDYAVAYAIANSIKE